MNDQKFSGLMCFYLCDHCGCEYEKHWPCEDLEECPDCGRGSMPYFSNDYNTGEPDRQNEALLQTLRNTISRLVEASDAKVQSPPVNEYAQQYSSKQSIPSDGNWFWVINAYDKNVGGYSIEIHRVILWEKSYKGVVGLISPELSGDRLQTPPPTCGQYKHKEELSDAEKIALLRQRDDGRNGDDGEYGNEQPKIY